MNFLALFFAGAFLCNAVPHLTAALRGEVFPSPFAKPPGRGPSPPLANYVWGSLNLAVSLVLIGFFPVTIVFSPEFGSLVLGGLAMGFRLSTHFGKARAEGSFTKAP